LKVERSGYDGPDGATDRGCGDDGDGESDAIDNPMIRSAVLFAVRRDVLRVLHLDPAPLASGGSHRLAPERRRTIHPKISRRPASVGARRALLPQ
jgi:hypothetical protein